MSQYEKLLWKILCGTQDNNISFSDLQKVLINLEFAVRIKGDHFIYTRDGIDEIINLQPNGSKAKPYQVRQVRNLLLKYQLGDDTNVSI